VETRRIFLESYPDVFQVEKRQSITCRHVVHVCCMYIHVPQTYMCAVLVELDRYPVPEKHVYVIL